MTKKQLKTLRKRYVDFMREYKSKPNNKVAIYNCPECFKDIETIRPRTDQVDKPGGCWDSAKSCPECGEVSWVKVWPSGKTEVVSQYPALTVIPSNI